MDQQEWDPDNYAELAEAELDPAGEVYWQQKHHNVCVEYNAQHWEHAREVWRYKAQLKQKDDEIAVLHSELWRARMACDELRRKLGMPLVDLSTRDTLDWHKL